MKTLPKWDVASGIRERLALLAYLGPTLDPHVWGYHPSRDLWYFCGATIPRRQPINVHVQQEGVASLAIILQRWGVRRVEAMTMIGYPEDTQ